MVWVMVLTPPLLALLALPSRFDRLRPWLPLLAGTVHLFGTATLLLAPVPPAPWIGFDALSRLILATTSLVYFGCAVYGAGYLSLRRPWGVRTPVICLLLFLSLMTLAVGARHLGLMWLALEAATLTMCPLIGFNRNRLSLEATWKYLIICSVGIALALLGLLFIAYAALQGGAEVTLHLDRLLAASDRLALPWLRAGFVLLLVGFGTKMGLAPLHTWKPDAYGEAPGMIGALLAGGVTNLSLLAILRGVQLLTAAGIGDMARQQLLGLGLVSIALAAVSMARQGDIKRLLAYSSVEHMGILAIGLASGGLAAFAALLHLVNNALAKGCLFLSAGNIHRAFDSKHLHDVRGAMHRLPLSGGLFLAGFLAITGAPPFGPFLSEFTLVRGLLDRGHGGVAAALLLALTVIFIGMSATVLGVVQGRAAPPRTAAFRDTPLLTAPPLVMLLLVLLLGLCLPSSLQQLLRDAAALLEVGR